MQDKIFNEGSIHAKKYYLNEGKSFPCNKNSFFRKYIINSTSHLFVSCLTGARELRVGAWSRVVNSGSLLAGGRLMTLLTLTGNGPTNLAACLGASSRRFRSQVKKQLKGMRQHQTEKPSGCHTLMRLWCPFQFDCEYVLWIIPFFLWWEGCKSL